ncbi:hypothetical protein GC194_01760 [bacterium]|nr:hypothetical protein [bacterium]
MPIVTLISDLGNRDYHIASVKGILLRANPQVQIVDITHEIKPFHYIDAAYILANCFRDFPEKTLHLVGVEGDFERQNFWILAELENHFFLTKNNGLLSLISEEQPTRAIQIPLESKKDLKFPFRNIVARAAGMLLSGTALSDMGPEVKEIKELRLMQPTVSANSITGQVVFVTPHQNVVTNIHRRLFESFTTFGTCKVHYTKLDHFGRIYNSYHEVPEGAAACFFGHNGFLEIGIHGGNALKLLTLNPGKNIWIEFE